MSIKRFINPKKDSFPIRPQLSNHFGEGYQIAIDVRRGDGKVLFTGLFGGEGAVMLEQYGIAPPVPHLSSRPVGILAFCE